MIKIYAPGTKVTLEEGVEATIREAIILKGKQVEYLVSFWAGSNVFEMRIYDSEITSNPTKTEIGFK